MDLSHLSEKEREAILQVLKRDEDLRKRDEQKLHHLKNELYFLRKRGAMRGDSDPDTTCSRCRVTLGKVLNRGATCNSCQSKVCKSCRAYSQTGDQWMCVVCHKQMEIQAASGEWMNEFIRRPSKRRDNKVFIPPADVVKHSIKRSWTSADGFRKDIDTSGAVRETPRQAGPLQVTQNLPKAFNQQQSFHSRKVNSRRSVMEPPRIIGQQTSPRPTSAVIHVPQPSITAPSRPPALRQKVGTPPKHDETIETEPVSPKPAAPSPAPRSLKSLPTPAPRTDIEGGSPNRTPNRSPNRSPNLQRSPLFKPASPTESERHNSSESQDSGYTTTLQHAAPVLVTARNSDAVDSGFDNQGSPRTSKSSGVSRQSSGVSSGNKNDWRDPGVESGSASDGSDNEYNNEVIFRKVMVRKKREKEKKMSAVSDAVTPKTNPLLQNVVQAPAICWGSIGGAHSLPRTKSRSTHSLCMPSYYCASLIDSDAYCRSLPFPRTPFSIFGGSLTLLRTEQLDGPSDLSNCCEDNNFSSINPWQGSLVLRSVEGGTHRKTPTGSPVVKRIRRSQRQSSERGGRLRSPERIHRPDDPISSKCSFEDVNVASLEFEEDLAYVARSFVDGDLGLGISAEKCIPESDDYKLVFISSSSSKSSGLNSSEGSIIGTSSANSSPRVSILDDTEAPLLYIDEKRDWDDDDLAGDVKGSEQHTLRIETTCETVSHRDGATVVSVPASETHVSASYREIVESFSPTHSVDEIETSDHVLGNAKQLKLQHVNRYFVRSDSTRSSSERSIEEVSVSHSFSSFVTNVCDDQSQAVKFKKPIVLRVSGWTDKDLNDPRLDDVGGDGDSPVTNFTEDAVNIVGETSVLKSTVVSEGWNYCINTSKSTSSVATADLTETQSVHCTVDDDAMSVGTVSEGALSCQLTPDIAYDNLTQSFVRNVVMESEKSNNVVSDVIESCELKSIEDVNVNEINAVRGVTTDQDQQKEPNIGHNEEINDDNDCDNTLKDEIPIIYFNNNGDNDISCIDLQNSESQNGMKMNLVLEMNECKSRITHGDQTKFQEQIECESEADKITSYDEFEFQPQDDDRAESGDNESIQSVKRSPPPPPPPPPLGDRDIFEVCETPIDLIPEFNLNDKGHKEQTTDDKESKHDSSISKKIIISTPTDEKQIEIINKIQEDDNEAAKTLNFKEQLETFADGIAWKILSEVLTEVKRIGTADYEIHTQDEIIEVAQSQISATEETSRETPVVSEDCQTDDSIIKLDSCDSFESLHSSSAATLIAKSEEIDLVSPTDDRAMSLENYFVQSLGGMTIQIAEEAVPNNTETETLSEAPSESTLDQWESEPEKLDESIDDSDTTFSDSVSSDEASFDAEEELRGFSRAIDFSLHTIIEESCEESDYSERTKNRSNSPNRTSEETELEKYFSFTIGNSLLALNSKRKSLAEESEISDSYSETSGSVCSENCVDKMDEDIDPAELASSRLEKYFMTGFLGIDKYAPFDDLATNNRGSESEGDAENGKICKRKTSGHSKGIIRTDSVGSEMSSTSQDAQPDGGAESDSSSSTLSDDNTNDEAVAPFDKNEGFDTIKRKKKGLSVPEIKVSELLIEKMEMNIDNGGGVNTNRKLKIESTSDFVTPLPDGIVVGCASVSDKAKGLDRKQQSRDSGFIGSSDDLLKDTNEALNEMESDNHKLSEEIAEKMVDADSGKKKTAREGSSSDDEARYIVGQLMDQITRGLAVKMNGSPLLPRAKPPELEMFEAELTKLMKTVPGIDVTVKEIVEELSSTDYYSDSYESSDYNSSEHEAPNRLTLLRRSLRGSLRSNDDQRLHWPKGDTSGGGIENPSGANETEGLADADDPPVREDANSPFTRETIYIYEKLMASLNRMAEQAGSDTEQHQGNQSPASTRSQRSTTLQAVQHIRERLTSLMREVQASSESSLSARVKRNNSSSSSSSWMGPRTDSKPLFQAAHDAQTSRPYVGNLHADITRWLARQPFHSDEQSVCSGSTNYESEDSPTDTELSVESDDTSSPAVNKRTTRESKSKTAMTIKSERLSGTMTEQKNITKSVDENQSSRKTLSASSSASLLSGARKLLSEEAMRKGASKADCPLAADAGNSKSLAERGVLDLQYFVTQGTNNEYFDEGKFKSEELASSKDHGDETRPVRARHLLLGSMKSSSSDTLQCISEEDLDSKASSTRTSMIGSSTNICSSQSSLVLRGSSEALGSGSMERTTLSSSPSSDAAPVVTFRKTYGFVAVDIPFKDSNNEADCGGLPDYRSSYHAQVLESGEISHAKENIDFRSSLHLWMENQMKPAKRAVSADPLPRDYAFLSPLVPKTSSPSSQDSLVRPKSPAFNLSDNQLDRRTGQSSSVQYSTMTKSGPIGTLLLTEPPPETRKALTLPRDLSANVSFLHKNLADNFLTNAPPTTVVPQDSLKGRGESLSRREVRSWTAEDSGTSTDSKSVPKYTKTAKTGSVAIPQISVSDTADIGAQSIQSNPSGRSSLCSQNTSDKESMPEEDIDRLVALHKTRSSLSSLGNRSDSMTSVYSAAGGGRYGTVDVRGEVLFGLGYNFKLGALEVHVKKCRDLAPVDIKRNRSDPYAKVYLLPDKSKSGKRKTKVKKHTLNPTFDEILRFFVTISELETRTLWLTVWHSDMFGRNDFLGEVMLPLGYDVMDDDSTPKWYLLQERLGPPEEVMTYKGELVLALKYVPQDVTTQKKGKQGKGKLHVLVKEARNLTAMRSNGTSDPFCKCYLLPDKSKNSKQKTQVVKKNCNPRWNHTFVYDDVDIDDLRERCLELTVWDYDRLTSNDFLGGVRLSLGSGRFQGKEVDWLDSRGDEIELWQNMLDKPNVWIDGFILLEPTMEKRPS